MNLTAELEQYRSFIPYDRLIKAVETPMSLCPEEICAILPSIEVNSSGPVLEQLFLVTSNYLCDIRLHPTIEEFDFIALNSIKNYRFYLSDHIIKGDNNGRRVRYQIAKIELLHELNEFKTQLNYAGHQRSAWLRSVMQALPLSTIL